MTIELVTIPEKKEDTEINTKVKNIVSERNEVIAKRFGKNPFDVKVKLFYDVGKLRGGLDANKDMLGIFCGYNDYSNEIFLGHPVSIEPIFRDNLYKQISIMADYTLTKLYVCKIFYPDSSKYRLFYKYLSECLAKVVSGNYQKTSSEFMIKNYTDFKKYNKEEEVMMTLFVMLEKSGLDFIFTHLSKLYEDCNIKKSIMSIYKKEFKELIGLYKKEMEIQEKKLKQIK